MNPRFLALITLVILPFTGICQLQLLKGTVKDAADRKVLAFVNVSVKGTSTGTVTDIDGQFVLKNLPANPVLVFSYIGYATKELSISFMPESPLQVEIQRAGKELENVVITTGENPALRIIRLAQENRKLNDPEQLPSFQYNAYTVAALGAGAALWTQAASDSNARKKAIEGLKAQGKYDTAKVKLTNRIFQGLKENYLMLTESYTERRFRKPRQSIETVIATRISGLKQAPFAFTTSNFQPFGFYHDYVVMLEKQYINPLTNGALGMYNFRLKETRVHELDTTFVIAFEPKKNKRFTGLKGLLYINSYKYAIESVITSAAEEKGLIMRFKLQQKYERIDNTWFPSQLNSTILQTDAATDSVLAYWDTRSYISNIVFNQAYTNRNFSDLTIDYAPGAGKRTETDWQAFRKDSLKEKEKKTYETYKLIPPKTLEKFNKINLLVEMLALEAIPHGKIDIPFKYFLSGINSYEKFRLGGGIQTNPSFSKAVSLGGYAGYGFGDQAFKYGANINLLLNERTVTKLTASFSQDIMEPGNVGFFIRNSTALSNQSLRNFATSRMDSVKQSKLDFSTKLRPFLTVSSWLLQEERNPAGYQYEYKNTAANESFRRFTNTETGLGIRITSGEQFTKLGRAKLIIKPASTELMLQVSRGLKGVASGQLEYTAAALQLNHIFNFKRLGVTTIHIEAGKIWGNVPYSYLFNLRAARASNTRLLYVPNLFQTVGLYDFAADELTSIFIQHNFGNLLLKPANVHIRPEFVLLQNISYGSLQQKDYHTGIQFMTPDRGIFESGLMIKNLYRHDMQVAYFGFGGGVFYRYGPYKSANAKENWAAKVALSLSF